MLLTCPTIFSFIFYFLLLIFICILIIFYYTKQSVLSYLIIFITLNNHVIVVHTCVDVTPLSQQIWRFPYPYGLGHPVGIYGRKINDMIDIWYKTLGIWSFSGTHIYMASHFLDTSLNIQSLSVTLKNCYLLSIPHTRPPLPPLAPLISPTQCRVLPLPNCYANHPYLYRVLNLWHSKTAVYLFVTMLIIQTLAYLPAYAHIIIEGWPVCIISMKCNKRMHLHPHNTAVVHKPYSVDCGQNRILWTSQGAQWGERERKKKRERDPITDLFRGQNLS